jgi:hypothetical protein
VKFNVNDVSIKIRCGNVDETEVRCCTLHLDDGRIVAYEQLPSKKAQLMIDGRVALTDSPDPLGTLVERFLWDCEAKRANRHLLDLAVAGTNLITRERTKLLEEGIDYQAP